VIEKLVALVYTSRNSSDKVSLSLSADCVTRKELQTVVRGLNSYIRISTKRYCRSHDYACPSVCLSHTRHVCSSELPVCLTTASTQCTELLTQMTGPPTVMTPLPHRRCMWPQDAYYHKITSSQWQTGRQ